MQLMASDLPNPVHRPPCTCIADLKPGEGFSSVDLACVCGDVERCLRGWAAGCPMPAMTPEQRAWCLDEIRRQGDSTTQGDFGHLSDKDLAGQVLTAWQDYARDKGMI